MERQRENGRRGKEIEEEYTKEARLAWRPRVPTDSHRLAAPSPSSPPSSLPPPAYLSTPRILHLQGGVTLKTLPVLNYPVPPSSVLFRLCLAHFFHSSFLPGVSLLRSSTILSALFSCSVGLPSLLTPEIRAMTSRTSHLKSPSSSSHGGNWILWGIGREFRIFLTLKNSRFSA